MGWPLEGSEMEEGLAVVSRRRMRMHRERSLALPQRQAHLDTRVRPPVAGSSALSLLLIWGAVSTCARKCSLIPHLSAVLGVNPEAEPQGEVWEADSGQVSRVSAEMSSAACGSSRGPHTTTLSRSH